MIVHLDGGSFLGNSFKYAHRIDFSLLQTFTKLVGVERSLKLLHKISPETLASFAFSENGFPYSEAANRVRAFDVAVPLLLRVHFRPHLPTERFGFRLYPA